MTIYSGEDMEKWVHSSNAGLVPTFMANLEITMEIPQENGNEYCTRSSNSTGSHTCKDAHSNKQNFWSPCSYQHYL